jgi:hypothetical protein
MATSASPIAATAITGFGLDLDFGRVFDFSSGLARLVLWLQWFHSADMTAAVSLIRLRTPMPRRVHWQLDE